MKNVFLFTIKKVPKTKDNLNNTLERINLNEKEENLLFRLIRKLGANYPKIASKFNRGSRVKFTANELKDLIESKTFKFNSKKNYWSPEEERILLEKHKLFGNKWSKISNYLKGRSDNNIKNFFYSKFRRVLRRIIKELYKDKSFMKGFVETGLVPEFKITVNYIYKILKRNDIIFERVNKDIVQRLLGFNDQLINNHQNQADLKTQNLIFPNYINNNANCGSSNPNSFQESTKENNENEYLQFDEMQMQNQTQMGATGNNDFNKINPQMNFNHFNQSSSFYSNSNSVSNSKNSPREFDFKIGSSQEKSKSDCVNVDTISETSGMDDYEKSGSNLTLQKQLFDKEINFFCFNERIGKRIENREIENSHEEPFSFINGNQDCMQDCFSYLSL